MKLLDLCCGAGGAAEGYARAGFDVTGVDYRSQPHYPYRFILADAVDYVSRYGSQFDVIHASPPCHDHSSLRHVTGPDGTRQTLAEIRHQLIKIGRPYIIENVVGAELIDPLRLCGTEFGLVAVDHTGQKVQLRRHRLFESNLFLAGAGGCNHDSRNGRVAGVYGGGAEPDSTSSKRNTGKRGGYRPRDKTRAELMGIDWMNRAELAQAIPPAYTEFLGGQVLQQLTGDSTTTKINSETSST